MKATIILLAVQLFMGVFDSYGQTQHLNGETKLINPSGRTLLIERDDEDSWLTFHDPGQFWYSIGIDKSNSGALSINPGGSLNSSQFVMSYDGKIGIGTESPNFKLHINSIDNQLVRLSSSQLGTWMDFENTQAASGRKIWSIGHAGPNGQFGISQRDGIDEYRMVIDGSGNIGIGTTTPSEKLEVNGTIRTKEVKVESAPWPDYVFTDTYKLNSLTEVSTFISENGHLPNIPTAKEVKKNGIKLGEMNAKLLEKIEELTLYLIQEQQRNNKLEERLKKVEETNQRLIKILGTKE